MALDHRPAMVLMILALTPVHPLLESGQLIKTDSCTCPEGIIIYKCVIDGTDPGGFTIWNGTAFSCGQSNNILLRHNLFGTQTGAFGSCNDRIISGQSLEVSSGNVYTSQLQVNITNSSRLELVGRTVQCVYNPDGSTYIVINSSTIMISDPLPPPNDVQLTRVKPNQLTFNWTTVQPDCSTLQYSIESNCGSCINHQPTMLISSASCSFELPVNSNNMCSFAIRSTICDSNTGNLSNPLIVTLKLPGSPVFQRIIPTYSKESKLLINAEVTFADTNSFSISSSIDGSALYYIMNFIDSNLRVCDSPNISASSCDENRVCTVLPVYLADCSQDGNIIVSVSAFNLLGKGQATNFTIESTNQYFDVTFESAVRVICSFPNDPGNQIKSCSISYGPCQQTSVTTMTAQSTTSSDSTVVIDLQSQLSNGHCYTVTASNGALSTVKIQGVFTDSQGPRTVAIAIGVPLALVTIILTFIIAIIIIARKYRKHRRYGKQEVHRRLLDDTDFEDNTISPHIIFDLEDTSEKFTDSLRTLSQYNVNIKNIKVCPSGKDKSHRTVYVECDHDLQSEVKEQLENGKVQLGSPGTLKIFQHPEPMPIKKDEDANSRRVEELEEVLKHEPGALCSWLEMFQEAEELCHISITDIIHEDINVPEVENCKKVTIKFIPGLSRNWKDKYYKNQKRQECNLIVSVSDVNTTPV